MASQTRVLGSSSLSRIEGWDARTKLWVCSAAGILGSLLIMILVTMAYQSSYDLFYSVRNQSSASVQAADRALSDIANVETDAVNFVITQDSNKAHADSNTALHSDFTKFRQDMFDLRSTVSSKDIENVKNVERLAYDEFWQHIGAMLSARSRQDTTTTISEFVAGAAVLNDDSKGIFAYLRVIEQGNYNLMVSTEHEAGSTIGTWAFLVIVLGGSLAVWLSLISLWLRRRIKRYLTPGLDFAVILSWVCVIVVFSQLIELPSQMVKMVEDAYYSVSAANRAMTFANQANLVESALIAQPDQKGLWDAAFKNYNAKTLMAICGSDTCISDSLALHDGPTIDQSAINEATSLKVIVQKAIGITPLYANITFPGEADTLRQALQDYQTYLADDATLRNYVANGQLDFATTLDLGQSDDHFTRFTKDMVHERDINQAVFDEVGQSIEDALPSARLVLGFVAYTLIIIGIGGGVLQRSREL
jgi:hypothetical protein